jgi:hypothetical protein
VAKNEVKVSVKVGDDGSLSQVSKKTKRATKDIDNLGAATDRATQKRNKYSKQEKGVAGLTSNSTKGFAKQAQTIGGTLVPAYATLAANIFAISAAFNALRSARSVEILEEGLIRVGQSASQNLPLVAQRLKDISGAAVSTADAMNTVALATSAGFSTTQMEELTRVARGASLALGRNMEDALTRLTRGAAKLEPEILDELGIMVRLDDAATEYGAAIGKTADQLTQVERRQAFLNAILEQGADKFGYIADSVDPNPYDQLAASFDDLSKAFLNVLSVPITPFIKFLSSNILALSGATVLFASSVGRQMLPILFDQASAAKEAAEAAVQQQGALQKQIVTTGKLPKVYEELTDSIIDGTATTEQFNSAQTSLNKSINKHSADLDNNTYLVGKSKDQLEQKRITLNQVKDARKSLTLAQNAALHAEAAGAASTAVQSAASLKLRATIDSITLALAKKRAALLADAAAAGASTGIFNALKLTFFGLGLSIKSATAALLTALPYLGIAAVAFSVIVDIIKSFVPEATKMEERSKSAAEAFSVFADSAAELKVRLDELETAGEKGSFALQARTIGGAFQSVQSEITAVVASGVKDSQKRINEVKVELERLKFDKSSIGLDETGLDDYSRKVRSLTKELKTLESAAAGNTLGEQLGSGVDAIADTILDATAKLAAFGDGTKEERAALVELGNEVRAGNITLEEFNTRLSSIGSETIAAKNAVEGMQSAVSQFNAELAKVTKKNETAFDPLIDQAAAIRNLFIDMNENEVTKFFNDTKDVPAWIGKTKGEVNAVVDSLQEMNAFIAETPALVKKLTETAKRYSVVSKESSEARQLELDNQQKALDRRNDALEQELAIYDTVQAQEENAARITEIELERAAIANQRKSTEEIQLEVALVQLNTTKKLLDLKARIFAAEKQQTEELFKQQRIQAQQEASNTRRRGNSTALNAAEELKLFNALKEARERLLVAEKVSKKTTVKMEYDLLRAQAALLRTQMEDRDLPTTNIDNYISSLDGAQSSAIDLINTQFDTGMASLALEGTDKLNDVQNAVLSAAGQGGTVFERMFGIDQQSGGAGLAVFDTAQEKFTAVTSAMMPMIESLQALGPEGEFAASIANLGVTMGDGFLTAFEQIEEGADKSAAILNAVSNTIGGIAQVVQAASQARISAIDKEIAAEQRRDGKSKESLAKIKSMESQKEKMARRAFDMNKKLMMAQAVASTAAGIAGVLSGIRDPFVSAPLAFTMAGIIGAMGAAQLAIISGTSYQGGSSSAGASTPSAVTLGARSSSVDTARSQSVGAELAYFRGQGGMGSGAENFKPSFMGSRYRAAGGETVGYTVGEQGPELFVPDRPGTIVPADDSANMMGGATNVSFSINAVDAEGVEEVLMAQRGNIIGMLRDAANSYGEPFMESINTNTFNKSRPGAYRR